MSALKQALARLISLFRRPALDREFDDEAQSHLDFAVEDYMRRGISATEARRLARVKFGAVEAAKDAHRDSRGLAWLDGILYDLRFALRGLRRDRAFTLTASTMLSLAIGLNVTVFAVMNTMLFRGFPLVKKNDRLVYIQERSPLRACCLAYPDFEDWRAQAKSFEGMAVVAGKPITFSDGVGGHTLNTATTTISNNAFGLLGVQPMLGRDFRPSDETPGAPPVAILSYRFWEARMGKRADVVGHSVRINNVPATVIGVMPEGFDFPGQENLWMPLEHTAELQQRAPSGYMAFARLVDGVSAAAARAELETINLRLASAYPATNRDVVPRVDTHSQFFMGPDVSVVYGSLWAAAWFVLLIACANLANLTLARTVGRSREFSTRIALGAGHWRMFRQILTESLLLAAASGVLAWWIAKWSVQTWAAATESPYQILDYTMDYGTLSYLVAISIAAALLFGLLPIGRVLQLDVNSTLKGDARGTSQGLRGKRLSAALVAVQMALAIVLLSGAGVLVRSLLTLVNADVGVSAPEKVLIGQIAVPRDKYPSPESRIAFFDRLKSRLLAIPGVEAASIANSVPVNNPGVTPFELDAQQPVPAMGRPTVSSLASGPDYFHTVGARIVIGRDFSDADLPTVQPVAIVNQSFVAKYWPGQDPVGKRLRLYPRNKAGEWRTIVGVASNIMQDDPTRQKFLPLVYVPFRQQPAASATFFARTNLPRQLTTAIRAEVETMDPDLTLENFSTLKASFEFRAGRMDIEHVEMGKHAAVAPIFAGIALLLAAIGLYAVMAHSVTQRTKEIGVRMAIGAAAWDIRRLIFREGMLPVALGLVVGAAMSLAVNRILQSQLIGVSPYDPVTLASAPVVLLLVALLACQIPSHRAIHVDPAVALRHD